MQKRQIHALAIAAAAAIAVILGGCTQDPEVIPKRAGPAKITPVQGGKVKEVTLTDQAVKRIGLEMVVLQEEFGVKVVPYDAVVYDEKGATYVFTSPKAYTYVRTPITVGRIGAKKAYLTDGPAVGTSVVVVGTAELYGAESGLGY